jgi:hypothetical protein
VAGPVATPGSVVRGFLGGETVSPKPVGYGRVSGALKKRCGQTGNRGRHAAGLPDESGEARGDFGRREEEGNQRGGMRVLDGARGGRHVMAPPGVWG